MSAAYPVMMDVRRLRVLVVGGGAVATRKVAGLVEAGGRPEVVAPEVTDDLRRMIADAGLVWQPRPYRTGDASSFRLVFAATDRPDVNQWIADDGRAGGALVSRADEGGESDFHVPSHLRRDDVVFALSTGGASPLLARRVRERLEATLATPGLGRAARRLADVRDEVQARWAGDEGRRRAFWFDLITPEFLDLAVAGRDEDVEQAIRRCLSQS
ncbi:bifunctional precorrin-2 dehydrogenase/sirohydrochlorin ferrochelatase [Longimicrobium sp.]|uniref:precorrin-2 dehydrogenase/sirohydrochlorin ferrochelatase family protein n=1 Tax=Longimicrobium sp. TaxID=2029185 RepID=UPI002E3072B3|nr:bifunctional precorrin-2 dehydrogenase/sirohydrochlorin ferrochelatase [Longimicrobium sp.]HEX6038459.1 bifunctional precorrin-2 dehydrogenase/sirohydrochlorin ferrochelatase [Longimicrobium sp.]